MEMTPMVGLAAAGQAQNTRPAMPTQAQGNAYGRMGMRPPQAPITQMGQGMDAARAGFRQARGGAGLLGGMLGGMGRGFGRNIADLVAQRRAQGAGQPQAPMGGQMGQPMQMAGPMNAPMQMGQAQAQGVPPMGQLGRQSSGFGQQVSAAAQDLGGMMGDRDRAAQQQFLSMLRANQGV